MVTISLPQPTLLAPYTLQQNSQPNIRPQFPSQPNPNPNNRPIQSVQIIESLNPKVEMRECNELKLRSGGIISPNEDKNLQSKVKEMHLDKPSTIDDKKIKQGGDSQIERSRENYNYFSLVPRKINNTSTN